MNEVLYSGLLKKLDKEWLYQVCDVLGIDTAGARGKKILFNKVMETLTEDPSLVIFLLNPLIFFRFISIHEKFKSRRKTQATIRKECELLQKILQEIHEEDLNLVLPDKAFDSSVALVGYLLETGLMAQVFALKKEILDETISIALQGGFVWNLICFYGTIEVNTFINIYKNLLEGNSSFDAGVLNFMLYYITLNLSDEVYLELIDGKEYLLTDFMGVDPEEIIEETGKINCDYYVPTISEVMDMFNGITSKELFILTNYLRNSFDFPEDEEFPEPLNDISYLTSLIILMKSSSGSHLNEFLIEKLMLSEKEEGLSYREFSDALFAMPRFGYKGFTAADIRLMDDVTDNTAMRDEFEYFAKWWGYDFSIFDEEDMDFMEREGEELMDDEDDEIISFFSAKRKKKNKYLN